MDFIGYPLVMAALASACRMYPAGDVKPCMMPSVAKQRTSVDAAAGPA
jgi:hypothetical protein